MKKILVLGAGKIGTLIALWLEQSGDYEVCLADHVFQKDSEIFKQSHDHIRTCVLDVKQAEALRQVVREFACDAMVSCLPFSLNMNAAQIAYEENVHYFDLTEDVKVTAYVQNLAQTSKNAFIPQCGLAPGFIGLAANSLMQNFEQVETVQLRVGALPQNNNNALHYALTWSTDGLINEYIKPCIALEGGQKVIVPALQNREDMVLNGEKYEAFNTSGGLGSLYDLYLDRVKNMNYKTIRYPGHCEKMQFLLHDLKLAENPDTLKTILEHAVPRTMQDVVIVYVSVKGLQKGQYLEESYFRKIFPQEIAGLSWSAIQVTTAAGLCGVMDLFFEQRQQTSGLILQEQFGLSQFLANRFGRVYQ